MHPTPEQMKASLVQVASQSLCCDCNGVNPMNASINNGIFLCDVCAEVHKTFGDQFSFVRSIPNNDWNYICYLYMELGNNENFRGFMEKYSLLAEPVAIRYTSRAAEYYRMRVSSL
eukprot:TRINITY_DN8332_c0_g1_i6.p1 TRINITY_DN8332_c0_g1~~TRINITY_DN8332_c0_g1_i6.p1  ORF type:complete len:116 (-),score=15.11 TRINITY_DN8332_c0_g1_i6:6-353(-)